VRVAHDGEQAPINRQQWYVGISRARQNIVVFTSDKEALRLNVERESDRELALSIQPDEATAEAVRQGLMEEVQHQLSPEARQYLHESLRQWVQPPQMQQQPKQQPKQEQSINRGIRI
jgi:hypothetical protein